MPITQSRLLFFVALFLLNCDDTNIVEFKNTQELRSTVVKEITAFSNGNVYLTVADTFLIITKSEEPFFKIYSTNSHNLIHEFGKEGRGPNELGAPAPIKGILIDSTINSPAVLFHDFKRNRTASFNLDSISTTKPSIEVKNLPDNLTYLPFIHYVDDEYLIGTPVGSGNLLIQHIENEKTTIVPYLPKLEFNIPSHSKDAIYRPSVLVNIEKKLIAASPLYLGELDFFDFEGNLIYASIFEPRDLFEDELSIGESALRNTKAYITELHPKNDLIFGLNYNTPVKNYSSAKWGAKISVFNWSGDPVKEYILDGRPIRSIAIDEIHNRIYAYDPTENEHNIVVYNLDDI